MTSGELGVGHSQGIPKEPPLQAKTPEVALIPEEVVIGLSDWLAKTGLQHWQKGIEAWAEEEGAAFLDEVLANATDIAKALQLNKEETLRFEAKLKGLPPPKLQAAGRAVRAQKKLPIAPSPCPCCGREERMLWNVTIASQHEGWGRKWHDCNYACQLCRRRISRDLHVNACRDCKIMWHGNCQQALATDQAKKKIKPIQNFGLPSSQVVVPQGRGSHPAVQQVPVVPVQVTPPRKQGAVLVRSMTVQMPSQGIHGSEFLTLDRRMSTPFTTEERKWATTRVKRAYVPLQAWNFARLPSQLKARRMPKEQSEILSKKEVIIEDTEPLPGQLDRRILLETQKRLRDYRRSPVPQELLQRRIPQPWQLQHPFEQEIAEDKLIEKTVVEEKPGIRGFSGLQERFMKLHGTEIKASLGKIFEGNVKLEKTQVGTDVQDRFMEEASKGHPMLPTFHGSNEQNYSSICQQGLLIPGRGNKIEVAHGSAHGKGIYTAHVSNPQLSAGFCTAPKMLVCGVLDDARGAVQNRTCGNFQVTAQSDVIKHVGDAVVVFDERRVVPLWQASAKAFAMRRSRPFSASKSTDATQWLGIWAPPLRPTPTTSSASGPTPTTSTFNVNVEGPVAGMLDAGRGKIYHVRTRQIAFLPAVADDRRDWIQQKRIYEQKVRDQRLKHCRDEKMRHMED